MKFVLIITSLISSSIFANEVSTRCDDITLFIDNKIAHINLSKEGKLSNNKNFKVNIRDEQGYDIPIEGFKADILKSLLIDSTIKTHYGLGVRTKTYSEVFAMKLKISAEVDIGHELSGCIMRPVKQLEVYGICTESYTKVGWGGNQ